MIIKTHLNDKIIDNINNVLKEFYEQKFKNTRVIIDVNPNNLL